MLNIAVAVDVQYPDADTINCGCYFAQLTQSKLTGILLEDLDYAFQACGKKSG
jgi:hypothetical protein